MSHWTVAKVKIVNPNMQLLKQALEVLAQQLGSKVVEDFEVVGWGGVRARAQLAIPLDLPYGNGFGVVVKEDGSIEVVGDDHGAPMTVQEFAEKLTQYYTALAVAQAAQELGWQVSGVQESREGVLIEIMT